MSRFIAWFLAHALYYGGDWAWRLSMGSNAKLWNLYQWCMRNSFDIQERAGLAGPWEFPETSAPAHEEEDDEVG